VLATLDLQRLRQDLRLGRREVEAADLDHALGEHLRQRLADERDRDLVAGQGHALDSLLAHDGIERLDELLRVLAVELVDVTLIARLRPAASGRPRELRILDALALPDTAQGDDEDARLVRIGDGHRVAAPLVEQPPEPVETRQTAYADLTPPRRAPPDRPA